MVMLMTLLILLLLGLLAAGMTRTANLELQMAGNTLATARARSAALAMLEALDGAAADFPLAREPGFARCTSPGDCDDANLEWPLNPDDLGPSRWQWQAALRRGSPRWRDSLVYRQGEASVSSAVAFDVAVVEARVIIAGDGVSNTQLARAWALLRPARAGGEMP